MAIIKWTPIFDPFQEMDKMLSNNWMGNQLASFVPAMDIYQTPNSVMIETPLAGIDPAEVSIQIENDVLTIEGKSEKKSEIEEEKYWRKEVQYGSFHRSVALPASVQADGATAVYENGVLKIEIPKKEEIKPKTVKIEIKSKK
jgi:HSP20 family protein